MTARPIILPPILEGCYTESIEERVRRFVLDLEEMRERWISRRASLHTQRAYRQDLDSFIAFAGIAWPEQAPALFKVSVAHVHKYRDWMIVRGDAPKTVNRRISSLSGFYRYLREVVAEKRLPIQIANPADKEFVARDNADAVEERRHFSAAKARRTDRSGRRRERLRLSRPRYFEMLVVFRHPHWHPAPA